MYSHYTTHWFTAQFLTVHYLLCTLTTQYSLIHCSLLTVHYFCVLSLHTNHCSLLTPYCSDVTSWLNASPNWWRFSNHAGHGRYSWVTDVTSWWNVAPYWWRFCNYAGHGRFSWVTNVTSWWKETSTGGVFFHHARHGRCSWMTWCLELMECRTTCEGSVTMLDGLVWIANREQWRFSHQTGEGSLTILGMAGTAGRPMSPADWILH